MTGDFRERLFDEQEFLSPYGIRAPSKVYEAQPYRYTEGSDSEELRYSPADSPVAMFGGKSNWRGPVWMPINFLLIESLQKFAHFYGDSFKVEFPTRSGNWINLWDGGNQLAQSAQRDGPGDEFSDHRGRPALRGHPDCFNSGPLPSAPHLRPPPLVLRTVRAAPGQLPRPCAGRPGR